MYKNIITSSLKELTRHLWNTSKARAEFEIDYLLGSNGEVIIFDISSGATGKEGYCSQRLGSRFLSYEKDFNNRLTDKAYSVFYTSAFSPFENERAIIENICPVIKNGKEFLPPPYRSELVNNMVVTQPLRTCIVVRSGVVRSKRYGTFKPSEPFAIHFQQQNPKLNILNGTPLCSLVVQSKLTFYALHEAVERHRSGVWYIPLEIKSLLCNPMEMENTQNRLPDCDNGYILKPAHVNFSHDTYYFENRTELANIIKEICLQSTLSEEYWIAQPYFKNHDRSEVVGGIYRAFVVVNYNDENHRISYDLIHHSKIQNKKGIPEDQKQAEYIECDSEANQLFLEGLKQNYSRTFAKILDIDSRAKLDDCLKIISGYKRKILARYFESIAKQPTLPLMFSDIKSQQWQGYLQVLLPIWVEHILKYIRSYITRNDIESLTQCCKDTRYFLQGIEEESYSLALKKLIVGCKLVVNVAYIYACSVKKENTVCQQLSNQLKTEIVTLLGEQEFPPIPPRIRVVFKVLLSYADDSSSLKNAFLLQAQTFYVWLCV